ncbi:transcription-repair coupling factor [Puniceicoccales bacterium CK1056]|uniref:Transcription-repair-coupling factor n=1 Tax=Oceanipulchritudo coccoides TaxID=2706888 RepID=A0A6B2M539_9BACT|nr:transcription-repair coupling factor [Oceanipulchritudo coccoides]NDV63486.1 transcription-repair coupling factor [Oceanipulchritudo coccoides]
MKAFRIPAGKNVGLYSGIVPSAMPLALADRLLESKSPVSVILCPSATETQSLIGTVPLFTGLEKKASRQFHFALLPAPPPVEDPDDPLPERLREELECDRLTALTELSNFLDGTGKSERLAIFTTPEGLFSPVPIRDQLIRLEVRLRAGKAVDFKQLRERLAGDMDYDSEAVCERPGQFALRGGLIDVYPLNASAPVRLDFFGDELESIRSFDPTTQRSLEKLEEVTIAARSVGESHTSEQALFDYFGKSVQWILLEPARLVESAPQKFSVFERIRDQRATLASLIDFRHDKSDTWIGLQELETDPQCIDTATTFTTLPFESLEPYRPQPLESTLGLEHLEEETRARKEFYSRLQEWQSGDGARIIGLASSEGKVREIQTLLGQMDHASLNVQFLPGDIPEGFLIRGEAKDSFRWMDRPKGSPLVVVSEREWLGRHISRKQIHRQRLLPHRTRVDSLLDFADLADGDYLVHLSHGICRYRGLSKMEVRGREEEVISIEFAENVTLHVPLHDAHLLTRYVGLTRSNPKLGKLGSNLWDKTRAAAEKATIDFASDMLQLQATRAHGPGNAFNPDTDWQRAFENAFPYKETEDQAQAIEDTKLDMELAKPMDRLVCGDVGFGKTEVAIRAAFKAVMDGYQVAIMVPTTVLAQQHFETFRERFAAYPISVEMLSRFRNAAQQKAIISETANGKIDLVVGTHRLLSKDVRFANLGLLVIDEEHRFGVRHKERLKQFKTEVDVLSMSATPIPRTLYLALMGARDLSVIETPPADRLPIETLVRTYDPDLVKRAITRELDRGGQVFYLHNRVQTIDSVAAQLNDLVPGAKIEVGHGQMSELQLERVMTQFVAGKTDILVCTTIIENGLDIPNCNTIIIEGADRFGLSQLYQLRGRVGRFKRQAYAYLLLHRHAQMLDLARKRLSAMRQHNQLGAGFRIAMRDLELRGAGNLLGHQQSGHIAGVGFDLYCQLLRQSIQRLKGEEVAARIRANVALDFILEGRSGEASARRSETGFGALVEEEIAATRIDPVSAYLPGEYLPETRLRIDFYRQLAMAGSLETVDEIGEALQDRFGKHPRPVKRLLTVSRIRVRAEMAQIRSVETEGNRLKCLPAHARSGQYIKLSGRFPRLTGNTADLRLRDIEQFLTRQCHNTKP